MLTQKDLIHLLETDNSSELHELFCEADRIRHETVGDDVHLRAIVEFSNSCERNCLYCGLRRKNRRLTRYSLSEDQILKLAEEISQLGIKTIVLQSGEDRFIRAEHLAKVIQKIKLKYNLAITLSVGEHPERDYRLWFDSGADRYLLKHETSDPVLYKRLHPDLTYENRLRCLEILKKIGYQVGSGVMVGLPGQTLESLAEDILLFRKFEIDMMGISPFVPNPQTPAPKLFQKFPFPFNAEKLTYKMIALTRIVTCDTMIPTTTALATVNGKTGRIQGLRCGANVIMPDATPQPYKSYYEIYPAKAGLEKPFSRQIQEIRQLLASLGRKISTDFGHRRQTEARRFG